MSARPYSTPEILRTPLDALCLQIKAGRCTLTLSNPR